MIQVATSIPKKSMKILFFVLNFSLPLLQITVSAYGLPLPAMQLMWEWNFRYSTTLPRNMQIFNLTSIMDQYMELFLREEDSSNQLVNGIMKRSRLKVLRLRLFLMELLLLTELLPEPETTEL